MSKVTTVGKILLRHHVPTAMKDFAGVTSLDKKGIGALFNTLAKDHPELYQKSVGDLARFGFEVAMRQGSSISLSDLTSPIDKKKKFAELETKIDKLKHEEKNPRLFQNKLNKIYSDFAKEVDHELVEEGVRKGNTLSKTVKAGARGSAAQLRQTIFSTVIVPDSKGNPLTEFPIKHSFAEGLSLPEYLASTYGARAGSVSTKLRTAASGYWNKQAARAATTIRVEEHDCGTDNGLSVDVEDKDSVGCFLAKPVDGYNKNNEVTLKMLSDLHNKKFTDIFVRSPITCVSSRKFHSGSICQLCAGKREKGLPQIGDYIGITSASALGEALSQGTLCLSEDTEVRMADYSTKKIKDIVVGDKVLGAGKNGETFSSVVINTYDQGLQPCNEYSFRVGSTHNFIKLIATENHKMLCNVRKSSCRAAAKNNDIQILPLSTVGKCFNSVKGNQYSEDSTFVDEPYAKIIGTLLGDGCYTEAVGKIHLSCADVSQIEELNTYLEPLNFKLFQLKYHDGIYYTIKSIVPTYYESLDYRGFKHKGPVNLLLKYFKDNGLYGKYAYEKCISPYMYQWNNRSIADLLAGLFVTDGSIFLFNCKNSKNGKRVGIDYSSTSEKMIKQVQELLAWRFCIYSNVYKHERNNKNSTSWRPIYKLSICNTYGVLQFIKQIPLFGIKNKKAIQFTEEGYLTEKIRFEHSFGRRQKEYISVGNIHCYDIEVANEDHLFVLANGLIVSNSAKHVSGSASNVKMHSGFDLVNQLSNIPKTFQGGAAIAHEDGDVTAIRVSSTGGHFIDVHGKKNEEYFVPQHYKVFVKVNDHVEQGDVMSEGIPNPADIVKYKGIGEGRKHYLEALKSAFDEGGMGGISRRNFETVAKSAIDHVQITDTDGLGDYLPGEIVSYQSIEKDYIPRSDSIKSIPSQAIGKYLEVPVLHYTIGTKVTTKVAAFLTKHKVQSVTVHILPPAFTPHMIRLIDVPGHVPDWMHNLYSTGLERKLIKAVNTGGTSDTKGQSPIPGLAEGLGFGGVKKADEEEEEYDWSIE